MLLFRWSVYFVESGQREVLAGLSIEGCVRSGVGCTLFLEARF